MSTTTKEQDVTKDPSKDPMWFMINAIMHTEAGKLDKIDWDAFSKKMDIKTKGAAMKRYERLLASYGLTTSYVPKPGAQAPGPAQDENAAAGPSTPARKRKAPKRKRADVDKDNGADEGKDDKEVPASLEDEVGN